MPKFFALQDSTRDSIKLLPDDKEMIVEDIAQKLGLKRVGWIFTDLIADDIQRGTVIIFKLLFRSIDLEQIAIKWYY